MIFAIVYFIQLNSIFTIAYKNGKYFRFPIDSLAPLITHETPFAAISRNVSSRECHFRQPREQVAFNKAPSRHFTFLDNSQIGKSLTILSVLRKTIPYEPRVA